MQIYSLSPRARGVYLHYTPSRGGIIDLYHDVDTLEATGSSKKLATCNFNRVRYIKHQREIYSRALGHISGDIPLQFSFKYGLQDILAVPHRMY